MIHLNLNRISGYDIAISQIVCTYQQWTVQEHSWNFINPPRPYHGIIYVRRGCASYAGADGRIVEAQRGDIMYLPKDSRYFVNFDPVDAVSVTINFTMTCQGEEVSLSDRVTRITHDTEGLLYERFNDLCRLYLQTNDRLLIKSELYALLSRLSQMTESGDNPSPIHAAILYMNSHINTATDIPSIARMYAMSESSFRREFHRIVGCSPKKYMIGQKIKKARQMLGRGDLPIGSICSALGFFDTAHFTKVFREYVGMTPAAYRKAFPDR